MRVNQNRVSRKELASKLLDSTSLALGFSRKNLHREARFADPAWTRYRD
jgi:hypothetical protein